MININPTTRIAPKKAPKLSITELELVKTWFVIMRKAVEALKNNNGVPSLASVSIDSFSDRIKEWLVSKNPEVVLAAIKLAAKYKNHLNLTPSEKNNIERKTINQVGKGWGKVRLAFRALKHNNLSKVSARPFLPTATRVKPAYAGIPKQDVVNISVNRSFNKDKKELNKLILIKKKLLSKIERYKIWIEAKRFAPGKSEIKLQDAQKRLNEINREIGTLKEAIKGWKKLLIIN